MRTKENLAVKFIITALTSALLLSPAFSFDFLNEAQAHQQAVGILIGDPYGQTYAEVSRNISRAAIVIAGETECGAVEQPIWSFQIQVAPKRHGDSPIEGMLELDAVTGELLCAGLPFLN